MESTRQVKVAKQIQKDISDIFQKHMNEWAPKKLLTVTVVRISADLSQAKIYVSVFPSDNSGSVLEILAQKNSFIRNELAHKIRHQVKKIPELHFFNDDSLDYIDNIDRLLKK